MWSSISAKLGLSQPSTSSFKVGAASKQSQSKAPVQVQYISKEVAIPDAFLTTPPAAPITSKHIDWTTTPLPEYDGSVALVLENVLSPEECDQLISLAEESVPREEGQSAWRPALINMGHGWEAPAAGYRESDRIIWDHQVLVDRLWERCAQAEGLRELLAEVPPRHRESGGKWVFKRYNERMRFLKYSAGQYFKPHCDGPYFCQEDGRELETFYTIQLYLNDSATHNPESKLKGGATSFLNRKLDKRVDVNPKIGSVLIFQHKGLLHEGATVKAGTKYTVRTDILYEWVQDEEQPYDDAKMTDA